MARNITEAKQYLVNEVKRIMVKAGLGNIPVEVIFRPMGYTFATAQTRWGRGKPFYGDVIVVFITFNEDTVRANIHNIENPFFIDHTAHEMAHVIDEVRHKKPSTHRGPFRRIYKSLETPTTAAIGRVVPPVFDPIHYYGGKGYGAAPRQMVNAKLTICQSCREVGMYSGDVKACEICGGDLIQLKDVSPKEIMKYWSMGDKSWEDAQDYLKSKYREHIPSFRQQKARRNKLNMLERAKKIVLGKRI